MLHKLLKNKKFILFIIIFDLVIIISSLLLCSNTLLVIGVILLIHIFIIISVFEFILKIHIINFKKIYNKYNYKKILKNFSKDEMYLKDLDIETFDGTGSLTHPSVLYFENGFNGYKYWLVYTPYNNNNVELENPCLAVSNDGINFQKPDGVENPLLEIIKKSNPLTFYNDPFLFYNNNRLEIWYRYTVEDKKLINDVYRIYSTDGVKWSKPELMIKSDSSCYMSLSITKKDDLFYMFYFDMDYKFNMRTSKDLKKWSNEQELTVKGFNEKFWHGEVRYIENHFELLFLSKDYKLYFSKSNNGINFDNLEELETFYVPKEYFYKKQYPYKSSFVYVKNQLFLYIPFSITKLNLSLKKVFTKKWKLTLSVFNSKNILKK